MAIYKFCRKDFDSKAVLDAAYLFSADYNVNVLSSEDEEICVELIPKNDVQKLLLDSDFPNQVLDQQVRINLETVLEILEKLFISLHFRPLIRRI